MIQVTGIITAQSPLHLGDGRSQGTFLSTLPFIPGRTLRGMLGYYLYRNDPDLFRESGIDEDHDMTRMGVLFRNAYPVSGSGKRTVISPLSHRWCKKCDRMLPHDALECKSIDQEGHACLHEGRKYPGFISMESFSLKRLVRPLMPNRMIETKCPITRDYHASPGGSEEGFQLSPYHIESLAPGSRFEFRMLVREDIARDIKKALGQAALYAGIGGFRSRGYGIISFDDFRDQPLSGVIETRAKSFSGSGDVTLVANAPLILRQRDRSIIGFNEFFILSCRATLSSCSINEDISYAHPEEYTVTADYARGWSLKYGNSVAELIPCTGGGSTVRIKGSPVAIATLEAYGIGDQVNCGYGEVYAIQEVA